MANLNKVMLIGRLTADPEIRYTPSGLNIANMRMAVNRYHKDQAGNKVEEVAYVDVTAFGRTAELAQQYLKKGRQVFVDGHLRFEQWDDKNSGQKRSKLSVTVENLQFLDSRGEGGGPADGGEYSSGGMSSSGGGGRQPSRAAANQDAPPGDDDIPF